MNEKRSLGSITASGRRVSGYAIIFDSPSEILFVSGRKCREIIKRSAVDERLLRSSDIKCYVNHNPERMVARSNKGKGSLMLSIDSKGLRFEFEAPKTADGDYLVEMIKRGDLTGCSFAFYATGESWSKNNGMDIRTVTKINRLDDVSIVTSPAYQSATLSVRNQSNHLSDNLQKLENVERIFEKVNQKRQKHFEELEAESRAFEKEMKEKLEKLKLHKR